MKKKYRWFVGALAATGVVCAGSVVAQEQEWGAQPEAEPAPEQQPAPRQMQPAQPAAPSAEMQQLQSELQRISMELSQIQEQAFELQEVVDAFAEYEQDLRAKMMEISPDLGDDIQRAEALVEELRAVEDPQQLPPEQAEEFQEKYMEFQQVVQRLQPVEQEASMDPEIQVAQQELETIVMDAMEGVSPDAADMMDERDQLIQQYMEMEQQQQPQQQQRRQMQPQPQPQGEQPQPRRQQQRQQQDDAPTLELEDF